MNSFLNAIKDIISANTLINYAAKTMYEFFVAEDYPALCLQPNSIFETLRETLAFEYKDTLSASIFYVERAPENREMDTFIQKVEQIKDILKGNPQLNGTVNAGFSINVIYHSNRIDDNNEFVAEFQIEGRNL
ncbi:hypothetical protein [Anoxybacter fermentans]|nr:hypothetical protein [Anoxybacter fermentans]